MNVSICIGSYRLPAFVELNIRACRAVFGSDVPISVSDSASPESGKVLAVTERLQTEYTHGVGRRSHFNGDMLACVQALEFGQETGADIALKISQRFVPASIGFKAVLETVFSNPTVAVAVPGRPVVSPRFRPKGAFYSRFPILTDVIAIRAGAVEPAEVWRQYTERVVAANNPGLSRNDQKAARIRQHVEVFWFDLLNSTFKGRHRIVPEWANNRPMQTKMYLRKTQAMAKEYEQLAKTLGMSPAVFDLREWSEIEKGNYYCYASAA